MVVSFRINKKGTRHRPKPKLESPSVVQDDDEVDEQERQLPETPPPPANDKRSVDLTEDDGDDAESSDAEVSFIISIYPDGYLIETPSESAAHENAVEDGLKALRPYDIPCESLFTAIELGQLPVNFLDDEHCKYVNGAVLCEVRDYRKESCKDDYPSVTKVPLKMSLDNVVKDIHLIADETWEYSDILEVEARILHALQPKLCLDPTPNLERLCKEPTCVKLNLDIRGLRRKRLRHMSGADAAPESSNSRAGDSSPITGQADFMNPVNQNVGESSTRPINHSPDTSNLGAGDLGEITGQSGFVNITNQNVGQSSMIATGPTNHAPESSISRAGDSRSIMGQPDFLNPTNQSVGQSNMIATRPVNHAPENTNMRAGDTRLVTSQLDFLNKSNQNVGWSSLIATRPTDHVSESSNLVAENSRSITGHPDFLNLANQNVGQSNMIATRPVDHAPENTNMRAGDARLMTGQPEFLNKSNQNVGWNSVIATRPTDHVSESSNLRAVNSRSITGHPDFLNLANQNVGQSNMIVTRPVKHAPENTNMRAGDARLITGQPDLLNKSNQNVGWSSMLVTRPTDHVSESSNLRAGNSRSITGHPDFLNLANQNVGQRNLIATRPINHAPESSNMRAGDSRLLTGQLDIINLTNQNVGQTNMTRPKNHAPENSNLRAGDSKSIMGQHGPLYLTNENVGQCNMMATRPINHAAESSNLRTGGSRLIMGQYDVMNMAIQNVGPSNMMTTRPINHAPEDINLRASRAGDSRWLTGQPALVNLVNQNVGQGHMIATRPINHAPENSNLRARDSRSITVQPGFVNLANQNVGQQSNMIVAMPINLTPESSNLRAGDSRLITGGPHFVNVTNQNVSQQSNIVITTRPINHAPESLISASSSVFRESRYQVGVGNHPRHMQNHAPQISCTSFGHDMMKPYMSDGVSSSNPSVHVKRGNPDGQMPCMNINKRCRSNADGNQAQQQSNRGGIQQFFDEIYNLDKGKQGRHEVKQEPLETETMDRNEPNRVHQRLPQQQFTRSKAPRNNMSQNLENKTKKEDSLSEIVGRRFGTAVVSSETVKSVVTPVVGIRSLTCSGKESMQQPHMEANWRSNSLPKTCGVGSSSNAVNMIGPFTASSPNDSSILDRFSTIDMLTTRFKLNCSKNEIDDYKPTINFPTQQLKHVLSVDDNNDTYEDEMCIMPLSMSLVGGNINICKTRILNFVKNERLMPAEDGFVLIPRLKTRLILSERARDGTVAMHLGELDDCDYLEEDHLLPTLANTHAADLFAAQFCSLMLSEGYHLEDDNLEPKPMHMVESSANSSCGGAFAIVDIQEGVVLRNGVAKSYTNMPTVHPQVNGGSLAGVVMASSSSSRSQQPEPESSRSQEQLQRPSAIVLHTSNLMTTGQKLSNMQQHHMVTNRVSQLQHQSPIRRTEPGNVTNRMRMYHGHGRGCLPIIDQKPMMSINQQGSPQALHFGPLTPTHAAFIAREPMMAHSAQGGLVGQCSNLGGNRQMHLGSGSSGVLMLGSGRNRANHINPMPKRNVIPQPMMSGMNQNQNQSQSQNENQDHYMNQQQLWVEPSFQLQTAHLPHEQEVASPSPLIKILLQEPTPSLMSPVSSCGAIQTPMTDAGNQEGTMDDTLK